MKIVHACLGCFFIDNSTYQENLLPKYHKLLGYDVEVIASTINMSDSGKFITMNEGKTYTNEFGIKVTRLPYQSPAKIAKKLCAYKGLYAALNKAAPDIIFIHGCQSVEAKTIVNYVKKHPAVKVYVDNHADFMNSAKNGISKHILHGILWKWSAKMLNPYVQKFYGVLPARVDFLKDVYDLPGNKTELLVLGADDELVEKTKQSNVRKEIREKYGISDSDVLIVTGGKIDRNRPETLNLLEAVDLLHRDNVKLLVFGNVIDELKPRFDALVKSDKIICVGWVSASEIYNYFEAGDLIVFPGLHSVLWEQAVGMGKACLFRRLKGFTHVDIGGNCSFIDDVDTESLRDKLAGLIDSGSLEEMKKIAEEKGISYFSYKDIAQRCIK